MVINNNSNYYRYSISKLRSMLYSCYYYYYFCPIIRDFPPISHLLFTWSFFSVISAIARSLLILLHLEPRCRYLNDDNCKKKYMI